MKPASRPLLACAASLTLLLSACSSHTETVNAPQITSQPVSAVIANGSNTVLSVVIAKSGASYQWYKDGAAISDATAATYTATAAGTYYVVVTDATGSVSSANATVTLTDAPVIAAQPQSATILTGTTQTLQVEATGAGLSYQWYKDGAAIDGATRASYDASAGGAYTVVVTNTAGSVTSGAVTVTVSATLAAPAITTQPASLTVNAGTAATLKVAATGTSIGYQWFRNGTAIPGATGPSYTIPVATGTNAGTYTVNVKNTAGSVTSTGAVLAVNVLAEGTNTAAVVSAANAFLATLASEQKTVATSNASETTVLFGYTLDNAIQWTNLPGNRHGLRLNTTALSAAQLAAANAVIAQALSATGITLMNELRAADEVLANAQANGTGTGTGGGMPPTGTDPGTGTGTPPAGIDPGTGTGMPPTGTVPGTGTIPGAGGIAGGYGTGQYSIAFIGTPSKTSPWMLQLVGHHLAYNITYNTGKVSATPNFIGVEPPNWSVDASGAVTVTAAAATPGVQHAPMEKQRKAVYDLAEAIQSDSASTAAARLSGTFTDVIMGASGNTDANFKSLSYPASGRGLQYTAMSSTQQAYVRAAIAAWVNNQATDVARTLLAAYFADDALNNTYVAYGVGQNGVKADFGAYPNAAAAPLDAQHSYIRIDGPRVWIEFVVQQGIVYGTDVHYHTIWRDKTADYGGSF